MTATSIHTLGAELERDRLESRVSRMTVAIGMLRQRERADRRGASEPRPRLGQVIDDFEAQIQAMNARLHDLGMDGPSIQRERGAHGHRY